MVIPLSPPLVPRDGKTLHVVAFCRISGDNQERQSLDDQSALVRRWLASHYDGQSALQIISGVGSGERLDRKESKQLEELIENNPPDLVIAEDMSRFYRRLKGVDLCERCEDARVRLIALNDHVDTGSAEWRLSSIIAVLRHEASNRDTSNRIKRSHHHRFDQGGVLQTFPYGYVKPDGAKTDADVYKDPEAEAVVDRWFSMLEAGATFAEVADWLNATHVPVGRWMRQKHWTGTVVGRLTRNPIYKGRRERNRKVSRRVNKTGRYKSVKADPSELLVRDCPHLAFIDPERYDRILRLVNHRNSQYARKLVNGRDPRAGVPKKRTRWPGQNLSCGATGCGTLFVYGAHGQTDSLMCSACREYQCWMAVSVKSDLARTRIVEAILAVLDSIPGTAELWRTLLADESQRDGTSSDERLKQLESRIRQLEREHQNLLDLARRTGASDSLAAEFTKIDQERLALNVERDRLLQVVRAPAALPSVDEFKTLIHSTMAELLAGSQEAARLMREIIPTISIVPVRLLDGGSMAPRAKFRINLGSIVPGAAALDESPHLVRDLIVDLFDPPQRAAFRTDVVRLRREGQTEREVAKQLGITITAAQRAWQLQRRMDEAGLSDPYIEHLTPPEDCGQIRRHKHKRFRSGNSEEASAA